MKKLKSYVRAISVIMCVASAIMSVAALAAFITGAVLVFMDDLYPIWVWLHITNIAMISAFVTSVILAVIGAVLSWLLDRI